VKNAIAQIASMLSTPAAGRAPDLLSDIFSIAIPEDDDSAAAGEQSNREPGRSEDLAQGETTAAQPCALRIVRISGGFTLQGTGKNGGGTERWLVEMAYRTRSGDPFRKYSLYDFAVGRNGVTWTSDGAAVAVARDNRLELAAQRSDFQLTVTGFDRRRDLVVRVSRKDDDAPEAELH